MLVPLVLCYSSYSYSNPPDVVNGTTGNATSAGYNWVMQNILPQQAGLEVNNVIYRYTAVKETDADMVVTVQNEDAQNPGQYIFREVDDWSQKPGKAIFKVVPQPDVLIDRWGDGSIVVEGEGTIEDAQVTYDYRYDPCFDPQSDPSCPGYTPEYFPEPINPLDLIYDPLEDELIQAELDKETETEDEEDGEDSIRMQTLLLEMEKLEMLLGGVNAKLENEDAIILYEELKSLTILPDSYSRQLISGTYNDLLQYDTKQLPPNLRARKVGLAQELLHQEMINSQYKR